MIKLPKKTLIEKLRAIFRAKSFFENDRVLCYANMDFTFEVKFEVHDLCVLLFRRNDCRKFAVIYNKISI